MDAQCAEKVFDQEFGIFKGPTAPPLLEINVGELLDSKAKIAGNDTALISAYQELSWTFEELHRKTRHLAKALVAQGVEPGDRVFLLAGNSSEFISIFFACTAIGAIAVLANVTFTLEETVQVVEFVAPKCIFVAQRVGFRHNDELIRRLDTTLGPQTCAKTKLVSIGDVPSGVVNVVSFDSFFQGHISDGEDEEAAFLKFWAKSDPSASCCFQFTSGTTGPRKVSMLSHRSLINNGFLVGQRLGFTKADRFCCAPPLFHCFGLVCGLIATVVHGSALILPADVFNPRLILKSLVEQECTAIHAVPPMFENLVNGRKRDISHGEGRKLYLRIGFIAGASLSKKLLQDINDTLGIQCLLYPFGMTELSAVSFCTPRNRSLLEKSSSVGSVLPHTMAKVIDEQRRVVPPETLGELCVSGYLLHNGYYKNPEKSRENQHVDDQGRTWLHTGDLVMLDQQGECHIVGRLKDIIKKGGENVAPKDIEEILVTHPGVDAAAVVGVPHQKWGEAIVAFTRNHVPDKPREKELKSWLREKGLAPHKMPDHFLSVGDDCCVVKELPVNSSGKILKSELKDIASRAVMAI